MSTKALTFNDTTVGKKVVMALSGVFVFIWLTAHMIGNLQVFLGPTPYNEYAKWLHDHPPMLWGSRFALLLAFGLHIVNSLSLWMRNRKARPVGYRVKKDQVTSVSAKTMIYGGLFMALYLVYHLAHLTFGVTSGLGYEHLPLDANGLPDVYFNVVSSFHVPWAAGFYSAAMVVLGLHLYHGAWSVFHTLGINHERYNDGLRSAASAVALAIVAGFLAVPVGVFMGLVQ